MERRASDRRAIGVGHGKHQHIPIALSAGEGLGVSERAVLQLRRHIGGLVGSHQHRPGVRRILIALGALQVVERIVPIVLAHQKQGGLGDGSRGLRGETVMGIERAILDAEAVGVELRTVVVAHRLDVDVVYLSLHLVAIGIHAKHEERVVVLSRHIPLVLALGLELVPTAGGEIGGLGGHDVVVTLHVEQLIDALLRSEHHVERLDAVARRHAERHLARIVETVVGHLERLVALIGFGCGNNLVRHVGAQRIAFAILNEVAGNNVIVLAAQDILRGARHVFLAVGQVVGLFANHAAAITRHEQGGEGVEELLLGAVVEIGVHVFAHERLEIPLVHHHVGGRLPVALGEDGVGHAVLGGAGVEDFGQALVAHSRGASEGDVVALSQLHALHVLVALVEIHPLLGLSRDGDGRRGNDHC